MEYRFDKLNEVFKQISEDAVEKTYSIINSHRRIFVYGAGRSGLMMKAFAMRLAQSGRTVYVVGESVTPAITKDDLLILASGSGKTPSVLRYADTAKSIGAEICGLTASPHSPLAKLSDMTVNFSAPTKDSETHDSIMGTLFEQSVLLFCDTVIEALGEDVEQMRARHANLE